MNVSETTTRGFDPTQMTQWEFKRKDGVVFRLETFWDMYIMRTPNGKSVVTQDWTEVQTWARRHSLPSVDFVERKIHEEEENEIEDPMGCLSDYE